MAGRLNERERERHDGNSGVLYSLKQRENKDTAHEGVTRVFARAVATAHLCCADFLFRREISDTVFLALTFRSQLPEPDASYTCRQSARCRCRWSADNEQLTDGSLHSFPLCLELSQPF